MRSRRELADVARGDRVLVSFVEGMEEARRIVVVSASDIARRNAAERLDWEKRGITGLWLRARAMTSLSKCARPRARSTPPLC